MHTQSCRLAHNRLPGPPACSAHLPFPNHPPIRLSWLSHGLIWDQGSIGPRVQRPIGSWTYGRMAPWVPWAHGLMMGPWEATWLQMTLRKSGDTCRLWTHIDKPSELLMCRLPALEESLGLTQKSNMREDPKQNRFTTFRSRS